MRAFAGDSTITRFRACLRRDDPFRVVSEVAAAGEVVFFAPAPAVRFVFGVVTGSFFAYEVAGATPVL